MRKPVLFSVATAALVVGGAFVVSLSNRDAAAQSSGVIIYVVDVDIVPDQMAKYIEAVKEHAAASIKEPGVREFNVTILADNPNHAFLYEVYENEAAVTAHGNSEHFKRFVATTANMYVAPDIRTRSMMSCDARFAAFAVCTRKMSAIAFNAKGR
jgi:(4S)-4-hydroxy-5-phosphonooxypentane-2,3-dione isomerase